MTVGVISHHQCLTHDMGEYHPEAPERMAAIQDQLIRSGLDYVLRQSCHVTADFIGILRDSTTRASR